MSNKTAIPLLSSFGYRVKKVYNSLKHKLNRGICMPDYPEFKFGIYGLRLRPSDSLRLNIARLGLPDLLNFFNASDINLHFRVSIPNKKEYRNISDSIYYEWILCNDEDKQVEKPKDPRFCFYNTEGNGVFEFSSAKPPKRKKQDEQEPKYYWLKNSYFVSVFQPKAIKIGNLSKLSHYKVIMRFTDSSGVKSEYVPMAEFTLHDKDTFRHRILLSLVVIATTAIAAVILYSCGIGWL